MLRILLPRVEAVKRDGLIKAQTWRVNKRGDSSY
jgi:hypothetical protein